MPRESVLRPDDALSSGIDVETMDWPVDWPELAEADFLRLNGHDPAWINAVAAGFKQRVHVIRTRAGEEVTGVLPLHLVSGPLFGRFLVSMPYINTGGVWAKDKASAGLLVGAACDLADRLDVRYLELRHEQPVEHVRLNFQRTEKVHMRLTLPQSPESLLASFKSKLRSQIKKAGEYESTTHFGGAELLGEFYHVFARNMRDLGTPVFSRSLFASILREFHGNAELCVVRSKGMPIAGGLLVHSRGVSEVPSASSLREYNSTGANMLMYFHLLQRAIERGSHTFDFGRSSEDSGTFKFKAQWGAVPQPAFWQYYVRHGSPDEMRPDSGGKQRLVKIWQRIPVWLTRLIGPTIVRGIP